MPDNLCVAVVLLGALCLPVHAQRQGCCGQKFPAAEFQVTSIESAMTFYHDVLGLDYAEGWTGKLNPPSRSNDALTGIGPGMGANHGVRVANIAIPGATWHLQLVDTSGHPRRNLAPRRQDIGATGLILYVRNLDAALAKLQRPVLSANGKTVALQNVPGYNRAVLLSDPDGFYIELRQASPMPANAPAGSNIVDARMALTVRDVDETSRYWRDLLDCDVVTAPVSAAEVAVNGVANARIRRSIATLRPNGRFGQPDVVFEFQEFQGVERKALQPNYQDPASGAFVLRLRSDSNIRGQAMTDWMQQVKAYGKTRILTTGDEPLDQGARFAVFTQDPDGFIMEVTQSVASPGQSRTTDIRKE
jgi:catechol 2,3-dioxygenase-like lactoylglutathione lyase family enzyme